MTNTEVIENKGSVGNISLKVRTSNDTVTELNVGSVLMATGFDFYTPAEGEFGYATSDKVITLPEFKQMIDTQSAN